MIEWFDGLFHQKIATEDGITHKVTTQPNEDIILERNNELRKNRDALRDLSFGRKMADIPFNIYESAKRSGYDLDNKDRTIADREMLRFLQTPMGRACMVREEGKHGRQVIQ